MAGFFIHKFLYKEVFSFLICMVNEEFVWNSLLFKINHTKGLKSRFAEEKQILIELRGQCIDNL